MKKASLLKNQEGIITLDFIFALTLAMGFSAILFAMAFTLSVVEVTQYTTFASARSYFLGHKTPEMQKDLALNKYKSLISSEILGSFYRNGWFEVSPIPEISDFAENYSANEADSKGAPFIGVRTQLSAKMLAFRIPFYGSTTEDENAFQTYIGSFVGREPSSQECLEFSNVRFEAIKQLDPRFGSMSNTAPVGLVADNGC